MKIFSLNEIVSSSGKAIVYHRTVKTKLENVNSQLLSLGRDPINNASSIHDINDTLSFIGTLDPQKINFNIYDLLTLHRTITGIDKDGVKAFSGMYGTGVYNVYDIKSQFTGKMSHYGGAIVKSFIKMNHVLVLDYSYAEKLYGSVSLPSEQMKLFKANVNPLAIKLMNNAYNQSKSNKSYMTADDAYPLSTNPSFISSVKSGKIKGIVFTGSNDGQVLIAYDEEILVPISWAFANDSGLQTKWFKFSETKGKAIRKSTAKNKIKTYSYDFNTTELERAKQFSSMLRRGDISEIIDAIEKGYLFPLMTYDGDYLIFKCTSSKIDSIIFEKLLKLSKTPLISLSSKLNGDNLLMRAVRENNWEVANYIIDNFKVVNVNHLNKQNEDLFSFFKADNEKNFAFSKPQKEFYLKVFGKSSFLKKKELSDYLASQTKNLLEEETISYLKSYKSIYKEREYKFQDLDTDKVYDLFSSNYIKATGKAWTKDKFVNRSQGYLFYGDDNGYVMVRPQNSGMLKLVGSAGDAKSIANGLKELGQTGKPVWGMVAKEMVKPSQRYGFITPPGWVIKEVAKHIPPHVFGTSSFQVNSDGSVTIDYEDVGKATKYLIGNKLYYKYLIDNDNGKIPDKVKSVLEAIVAGGAMWQKFTSYL